MNNHRHEIYKHYKQPLYTDNALYMTTKEFQELHAEIYWWHLFLMASFSTLTFSIFKVSEIQY